MAHVKIVSPSGWDRFEGEVVRAVKVASGGLRGHDRREFVKRAGASSNVFLPYLDGVKVAADEEPIHVIALGAEEAYGPNRNGDAFDEHTCKTGHDTFVKFARWYRNHKNKDPGKSYGVIKLSAYNPDMRRVELLVALNKEKSAAERNGGFVADKELTKLARGEDIAVSMACRVPYDVCTFCGNKARTREEYCKAASCGVGGCADNLTRLVKRGNDVHMVAVRNPGAVWFDMSDVHKPADRICYGNAADYLAKAAADGGFMGRGGALAALGLGVTAPPAVILAQDLGRDLGRDDGSTRLAAQVKLAHALADAEDLPGMRAHPEFGRALDGGARPGLAGQLEKLAADVGEPGSARFAASLGALADRKIVLGLGDFAALTKRAALAGGARGLLPGVYRRMIDDGSLEGAAGGNRYQAGDKAAGARVRDFAARKAWDYSLEKDAVDSRVRSSVLRGLPAPDLNPTIQEGGSPAAEALARDYALYKLAALYRIAAFDGEFALTARLALAQNLVA